MNLYHRQTLSADRCKCNYPDDTQGCILVGENKFEGMVVNSRIWLQRLINAMTAARDRDESIWITIL